MQMFQMAFTVPLLLVLLIFTPFSGSTSTLDTNNIDLAFMHKVKELVSFVRLDIEKLDNGTSEFNSKNVRQNLRQVVRHCCNVGEQLEKLEDQHVTKPESYLYESMVNGSHMTDTITGIDLFPFLFYDYDEGEEKLLNFTMKKSRITDREINSDLRNEVYMILHGIECKKNDNQCMETRNHFRRFRQIDEFPMSLRCRKRQSAQQLLYSLSKQLALAELTAYIVIEYSIMVQKVSTNETYISERNTVRHNYDEITKNALDSLRNATKKADRHLWRCDPVYPVRNVDYAEVTRLLQGYIENEVDLNNDGSCSGRCSDYQNATRTGCFEQKFCSQQPKCSGRIYNCQFVHSDLSVCQSPKANNRRYDNVEYGIGQKLVTFNNNCRQDVEKVQSWDNEWFDECSYCFCLCDEQGPRSHRYFNLRETLSDIQANKVVTGLRFVKKKRVFHLQIQQGQLLPRGVIKNSTVEWKPVNDYKVFGSDGAKEGVDYHTLTYQSRAIDLDDVMTDDRTLVVTGVSFQIVDGHLNLKVRLSKFDFEKGELINPEVNSIWQSKENVYNRQRLHLDDLQIYRTTREVNWNQTSKDTQYLEFTNSGVYKDAAQTTIPFIDIQDVASIPPVPLAGIGIYYKGTTGFGGTLAPKIISYDISPHFEY